MRRAAACDSVSRYAVSATRSSRLRGVAGVAAVRPGGGTRPLSSGGVVLGPGAGEGVARRTVSGRAGSTTLTVSIAAAGAAFVADAAGASAPRPRNHQAAMPTMATIGSANSHGERRRATGAGRDGGGVVPVRVAGRRSWGVAVRVAGGAAARLAGSGL